MNYLETHAAETEVDYPYTSEDGKIFSCTEDMAKGVVNVVSRSAAAPWCNSVGSAPCDAQNETQVASLSRLTSAKTPWRTRTTPLLSLVTI
mmetsp:Transcript_3386/g.7127  ORF Transcript_3386/g.7127 Transcript_3386/m.7127 type:complete len:91 (-) Transcript_3386:427-699(-)